MNNIKLKVYKNRNDYTEQVSNRVGSFRKIKKLLKQGKTLYLSEDGEVIFDNKILTLTFWNNSLNPDADDFTQFVYNNAIWQNFKCKFACWDIKKCIGDCTECKYIPKSELQRLIREYGEELSEAEQ